MKKIILFRFALVFVLVLSAFSFFNVLNVSALLPPPPPVWKLTPTTLSFNSTVGGYPPDSQSITLSNFPGGSRGDTTISWTATTDQLWCHVSPQSGTTDLISNSPVTFTVSLDPIFSASGTYQCNVTVASTGNANTYTATTAVTYNVTPGSCPSGAVNSSKTTISIGEQATISMPAGWSAQGICGRRGGGGGGTCYTSTYTSDNTATATVDGVVNGVGYVTGVAPGVVNVSGTGFNSPGEAKSCTTNSDCYTGQLCDSATNTCVPPVGSVRNCPLDAAQITVIPSAMSGILTPAASSCVIASGASSCNINFTWTTINPQGTSAITRPTNVTVTTGNNGTDVPLGVKYNSQTFYLYNNAVLLAQSTVTSSCISGTSWNGNICAPIMSGTLTPSSSSCVIPKGANTCNINFSWNTNNPQGTSAITTPVNETVANGNANDTFPLTVNYNSQTFYLYNNTVLLDQNSVTSSCVSGTAWDGSKCSDIINGAPGTANGKTYPNGTAGYGSDTQCSAGTSSNTVFPSAGGTASWSCLGLNGGTDDGPFGASQAASSASVNISVGSTEVVQGKSTTLTWSSNATSCTGMNFSTGGASSGSVTVYPVPTNSAATITYTVTCNGVPMSTTVHVKKKPVDNNG